MSAPDLFPARVAKTIERSPDNDVGPARSNERQMVEESTRFRRTHFQS